MLPSYVHAGLVRFLLAAACGSALIRFSVISEFVFAAAAESGVPPEITVGLLLQGHEQQRQILGFADEYLARNSLATEPRATSRGSAHV